MFTIIKTDPEIHVTAIHGLIQELANFENMPDGPKISEDQLKNDLIKGRYGSLVALNGEKDVIGYTIYYYAYSTWNGPFLFMEDLYVTPEYRKKGVGKELWQHVAKVAHEEKLSRIEFSVLNWNSNAINFYKKMGAVDMNEKEGWILFRLTPDNIEKLADGN